MGGIVAASILQGHRINTLRFDRQCFQRAGEENGGGTVTKNVDGVVRRMRRHTKRVSNAKGSLYF